MNRRKPPTLGPEAPGDQWQMDPRDVQRYARRMREAKRTAPLARVFRFAAVALLVAGLVAVYFNFETLTALRLDLSRVTDLFAGPNQEPAGARPTQSEPGTEVVDGGGVAGVSMPTSIGGEAPEAEAPDAEAPEAVQPPAAAPDDGPATAETAPPVTAPAPQAEPEPSAATAATAPQPRPEPRPVPPPEPEVPARPETIGFGVEVMTISEADASAAVLVLRDGGRRGVSSFTWWTTDGTARSGADFARLEPRVERFNTGEQNRTVHVPIIGDRSAEGPENFYVHVVAGETANPPGVAVARIEVVINDDD